MRSFRVGDLPTGRFDSTFSRFATRSNRISARILIPFPWIPRVPEWRIAKMKRTISAGVAAGHRAAIVGALLFALRAGALAQTVPSVDELVDKNTAALGGSEKIRAIQSIKGSGRLIRGGMEFPLTIYLKRPGLRRDEINVHGKSIIHAFDGSDTWTINHLTS